MVSRGGSRPRLRQSIAPIPQTALRSGTDKENFTSDINTSQNQRNAPQKRSAMDKKLRSKSLGPGGLDALKAGNGNRRKSTVAAPLKSILKPAIPVSPLQTIPTFEETRRKTPARSPQKPASLLIDFSTPPSAPVIGTEHLPNPFDTFNPTPARNTGRQSDEQQRIAEQEKEARERHERQKRAALEQRAARRKSLANRRVSFAPEATLHTWNVVELMEDSTASTASTNPTRRASTLALAHHNPPSSPEEENDALEQFSPADRGSLDQRQYRQSPGAELDNIDNDEAFSSSPFSGDSGLDGDDTGVASLVPESHDNLSDSDLDNDSTAMSLDATQQSIRSTHSNDSTTDSARLDRSLRLAARIAGTNGIEYDENGDLSVENANLEIAGAFKPWIKKGADRSDFDAAELTSRFDQENVDPRQKPFSESQESSNGKDSDEIDETGMDLTDAVGGILSKYQRRDPSEYSTDKARRISSATSYQGDQTMELTNVVGGIHKDFSPARDYSGESDVAEDEEMTMEFTSVFGGVLNKILPKKDNPDPNTDQPGDFEEQDEELYPDLSAVDMEMIGAVGGILPPIEEQTEPVEDETMGMEMTNAIGKILPSLRPTAGVIQDDNSDHEPASSPFQENIISSPPKPTTPLRIASRPSPEESPTLSIIRLKPNQRRSSSRLSTTPTKSASQRATPAQKTLTPSKQKSPRPIRSTTPATPTVTPPTRTTRSSPRKQNKSQPQKSELTSGSIFQINHENGHSTPKIVLQARRRSPSGLGADKEGLGSPRVAEILDRRKSIGEDAQSFTPASQKSRESQHIESHNLQDGIKEELHVPGRQDAAVTESTEARRNVSFNIREMISQLTPKKDKLKGRKSLHVGAAKGLLGKRPVELDIDDDEDSTPKRLRVRELSPVKNVKLPAPPSKAETVGKISHLSLRNTTESPSMSSRTPLEESIRSSGLNIEETINRTSQEVAVESEIVQDPKPSTPEVKRLQLSEFLELTNIHFMELTTTKRRQTLAVDTEKKQFGDAESEERKETSLEDCVAAGLCTIPMLELYQHSCRELKSYISEGRRIIRSIETETYAENPPLFQEYVTAPPDIRLLMDNQFRNVKAHARLLSKSMWYEWRMKLLEGLKQGLDSHVQDMIRDARVLSKKEELLGDMVPELIEMHARLQVEAHNLKKMVEEMESCDQEELRRAREKIAMVEQEIAQRKTAWAEAQANMEENSSVIEVGAERKALLLKEIEEAESVLEECRGWSVKEVGGLRATVQGLEKRTGWSILSATQDSDSKYGPALSMRYRGELRLDFHPTTLQAQGLHQDRPITLSYAPDATRGPTTRNSDPTPELALILHALRTRISHLSQTSISPKTLLCSISRSWDTVCSIRDEIRALDYCGVTKAKTIEVNPHEPALLKVRCILLGTRVELKRHRKSLSRPVGPLSAEIASGQTKARLDIDFTIKPRPVVAESGRDDELNIVDIDVDVDVSAAKVYGFSEDDGASSGMSEGQIGDFLTRLIHRQDGKDKQLGKGLWKDAVKELENKAFS